MSQEKRGKNPSNRLCIYIKNPYLCAAKRFSIGWYLLNYLAYYESINIISMALNRQKAWFCYREAMLNKESNVQECDANKAEE